MADLIVWVDIPVTDMARAKAFYSALLGAPVADMPGTEGTVALLPMEGEGSGADLALGEGQVPSAQGCTIDLNTDGSAGDAGQGEPAAAGSWRRKRSWGRARLPGLHPGLRATGSGCPPQCDGLRGRCCASIRKVRDNAEEVSAPARGEGGGGGQVTCAQPAVTRAR